MDFDPFLTQIRPHFGLVSGSFLAPFLAPLRGAILSENTRKTNVFHCFGAPKRLSFGAPFGLHFGSIFAPFWAPFRAPFGPGPNLPFCVVFRLARPTLGAGARKSSPDPSHLINLLGNFLENPTRNKWPRRFPSLAGEDNPPPPERLYGSICTNLASLCLPRTCIMWHCQRKEMIRPHQFLADRGMPIFADIHTGDRRANPIRGRQPCRFRPALGNPNNRCVFLLILTNNALMTTT